MGWETRRGQCYYYRKRRVGRRVVSEYVGRGDLASALAGLEAADRLQRAVERDEQRDEMVREQANEDALDAETRLFEAVTACILLAAGCHTHKGTWRRTR